MDAPAAGPVTCVFCANRKKTLETFKQSSGSPYNTKNVHLIQFAVCQPATHFEHLHRSVTTSHLLKSNTWAEDAH